MILKMMKNDGLHDNDPNKSCMIFSNVSAVEFKNNIETEISILTIKFDNIKLKDIIKYQMGALVAERFHDHENNLSLSDFSAIDYIMQGNAYLMDNNGKTFQTFKPMFINKNLFDKESNGYKITDLVFYSPLPIDNNIKEYNSITNISLFNIKSNYFGFKIDVYIKGIPKGYEEYLDNAPGYHRKDLFQKHIDEAGPFTIRSLYEFDSFCQSVLRYGDICVKFIWQNDKELFIVDNGKVVKSTIYDLPVGSVWDNTNNIFQKP